MAKQKTFIVTKVKQEGGCELTNQYMVEARSRKEAMEHVLEQEKIIVGEVTKCYYGDLEMEGEPVKE